MPDPPEPPDDDNGVQLGAVTLARPGRTVPQSLHEAKRQAKRMMREAADLEHGQRKCRGKVKLRDADGNVLRHPDNTIQTRPCKRAPIRGGFVCPKHGGSAPQVKKKAERRLQAMLEPAIIRMDYLMHQDEHMPTALAAVLAVQNRVLGAVGKPDGEKDTRPVINIGIAVGGVPMPQVKVSTGLLTPARSEDDAEGEVVDADDEE